MSFPSPPRDPRHRLLALTRHISRCCDHQDRVFARAKGLTSNQWHVLTQLWEHDGLAMSELADELRISRSTATRLVDVLEKKGLVRRRMSPDDRRQLMAALTPQGESTHHEILDDALLTQRALLASIATPDREPILLTLELLARALERSSDLLGGTSPPLP